ncbi:uncharacterized protein LOC115033069 [Acyrthosiphon pisum]|uniref:DUF4371 domain-containing protein n=1 Tax=Acyrthosiphon pisum TaxID=7029 RepID=A0A8R2JKU6_ACYPI|nr:uncharacterized protein LOC115033069 [Acyrthosiphon pisum]
MGCSECAKDGVLDNAKKENLKQCEANRIQNRTYLVRIIDLIMLLGKCGQAFRGHNEKEGSNNRGLFLELPSFFVENISSMHKNKYVSIIADETSDCGHHEQMSIVVRFFDTSLNKPVEYFMGLQRLLKVDSQSIFEVLNNFVENIGVSWENVISVCFDGAANMPGCHYGVQMKFLVDSIERKNVVLFDIFGTVQLIYSFLEGSCWACRGMLWACRYEAVSAVKSNYSALILALEEIYKETTVSEARAKARGILMQMKSFDFIFSLNMMHSILMIIVKEKLGIISAVGNTLQLIPTDNNIQLLQEKLKVNSDCFKTEIKLLKELPDTPEKTSS